MPRRRSTLIDNYDNAPVKAEQTEDTTFGALRSWLGAGVRVASGVTSGVLAAAPGLGSIGGAAVSGAGESLAEFVEGSEQNPYRIAAETALGAVPFGKWIGAARGAKGALAAGRDFLAGGAAAGLGEAGREWAEGEDMSLGRIGGTALVGGTLGAGGGALARRMSQGGGPGGVLPRVSPIETRGVTTKGGTIDVRQATPPREGVTRFSTRPEYEEFKRVQGFTPEGTQLGMLGRADEGVGNWTKTRKSLREVVGERARDIKANDKDAMFGFNKDIQNAANNTFKGVNAIAKSGRNDVIESLDEGIEASNSLSAAKRQQRLAYERDVTTFDEALTKKYGRTDPQPAPITRGATEADDDLTRLMDDSMIPADSVVTDPIARLMNAVVDNPGGSRQVGAALPEAPAPFTALSEMLGGRAAQQHADPFAKMVDDLGLPEDSVVTDPIAKLMNAVVDNPAHAKNFGPPPSAPRTNFDPTTGITEGPWVAKQMGEVARRQVPDPQMWQKALDALKNVGRGAAKQRPKGPKRTNESGFIAGAELAGGMAGGLGGGLYGATQEEGPYAEEWQNRARNAALYGAAGAGVGFGVPRAARAVSEGNLGEVAEKVGGATPNLQRFNFLASIQGLPANAIVGPYGSAVSGGAEAALAAKLGGTGDDKGIEALKELINPANFGREFRNSKAEALRRMEEGDLGRADYEALGNSPFHQTTTWPGLQMTRGDIAGGHILERAGFDPKHVREIMLTSEAEHPLFKQGQSWGKGSKLGEFLFPFRRTPFNALEQGARRLPGIGLAAQYGMREEADPINEVIAQQLLGTGYAGAGYLAGDNVDPETAKWLRRYVTNASGRYGLGAGLGFAMGQAHNRNEDKEGNWFDKATPGLFQIQTVDNILPLPTIEPVMGYAKMGQQMLDSEPNNVQPPRGSLPQDLYNLLFPPKSRRSSRRF